MSEEVKTLEKKVQKKFRKVGISSAELRAEVAKMTRSVLELREEHEKTERALRKLSKIVGSISNNNGKAAEEFFANSLEAKPVFCGETYESVLRNLHPARGGKGAEFDIVMTNGNKVVLIEVKYCAHPEDLRKLVELKVSEFRKWCPSFANHKVYLGIASLSFADEVLKEAQRIGVAVLRQIGDTLEITNENLKAF
jgi:Holliday junction resolvase-like predicted endonuclease